MKKIKLKKQFLILWGNGKEYQDYMCYDLEGYKNVYVINNYEAQGWQDKRTEMELKFKNKEIGGWFFRKQCIRELKLKKNKINYLIFSEDYIQRVEWEILEELQKQYSIKTVLYINDTIERRMNLMEDNLAIYKEKLDLIITTDRKDAIKYNIIFFPLFYSKICIDKKREIKYDISFVGRDKGREELVRKVKNEAEKKGLIAYFRLREGLNLETMREAWIPYKNILNTESQSNCIFEVLQKDQSGISLRTMEAIILNKKLLTNNADIVNYPFYDNRFIQVFSGIEDIDFDFVKKRTEVLYNYHDEYSPTQFLRKIIKILQ